MTRDLDLYYDPDGHPIDYATYAQMRKDGTWLAESLKTDIGDDVQVSTVWLGMDHGYDPDGPPIIYETLIFGGPLADEMWRYATREEARAGHERAVRLAQAALDAGLGEVGR